MPWWENEFLKIRADRLVLRGIPAAELARRFGTPLFVYGADRLRANYRRLASAFEDAGRGRPVRICYAMKANAHSGILDVLRREGAWIDAVSPGEVRIALEAGYPPQRILFTGTSIGPDDFAALFGIEGLIVNIDAPEQIGLMKAARNRVARGRRIKVSVRWNPGLGRGFHPKAVTAGARAGDGTAVKFGVEPARVMEVFRRARAAGFEAVGLHQHLGSGWTGRDYSAVLEAVEKMIGLAQAVEKAGFPLEFLDFGGGFGPRYHPKQSLFRVDRYARAILRRLDAAGIRTPAVAVEPGKFLVADAGALLLRVEYVKRSFGNTFACVNGGTFNTIPRPAIYASAQHKILNAVRFRGTPKRRLTVAGHLCETGDVFGKDVLLPLPRAGEILAVLHAGAYARSMASRFNQRPIPEEILI